MRPSMAAIGLIKKFESCRLTGYPDPGTNGLPITIGWGHTGPSIKLGQVISQATADSLLSLDAVYAAMALGGLSLNQNQYDALVSFIFNVGTGAFRYSTMRRLLQAGDHAEAAKEFLRWTHAGGKENKGLLARRKAEQALFTAPLTEPYL